MALEQPLRLLFSSSPGWGHVLPLLPLARAAARAGHDVAVLTDEGMRPALAGLRLLPVGPDPATMFTEGMARWEARHPDPPPPFHPESVAIAFADVRLDLGGDDALASARDFRPDLVISEPADALGPLTAAGLGVPWAEYAINVGLTEDFYRAMAEESQRHYVARGLTPTPRVAIVDPWPPSLHPRGESLPADRIAIRPEAHSGAGRAGVSPALAKTDGRPLVLITMGTVFEDSSALRELVDSVLAHTDAEVLLTAGPVSDAHSLATDRPRLRVVDFVPLRDLLEGVDVAVGAGSGTVLGVLSTGRPMVLMPTFADQPMVASHAAAAGVARVVSAPREVGPAVAAVLTDPSYRAAATRVAREAGRADPPARALTRLIERVPTTGRVS